MFVSELVVQPLKVTESKDKTTINPYANRKKGIIPPEYFCVEDEASMLFALNAIELVCSNVPCVGSSKNMPYKTPSEKLKDIFVELK